MAVGCLSEGRDRRLGEPLGGKSLAVAAISNRYVDRASCVPLVVVGSVIALTVGKEEDDDDD